MPTTFVIYINDDIDEPTSALLKFSDSTNMLTNVGTQADCDIQKDLQKDLHMMYNSYCQILFNIGSNVSV